MGLSRQLFSNWCLLLIMCPVAKSILYDRPSIWTRCYMGMSSEMDLDKAYAGYVFIASSATEDIELKVNEIEHGHYHPVLAEAIAELPIFSSSIQPQISHITQKLSFALISLEPLAMFYRDSSSFYQLRETQLLSSVYTVITYHRPNTSMLSVVNIAGVFEGTMVTMKFQDGVNVTNALGELALNFTIRGQEVSRKFGYRALLKLQAAVDLTGTVISGTNELSVVAGTVPVDASSPYSYIDHLPGDMNTGTEYVVFGLPVGSGSCVCRVMSLTSNVDVDLWGTNTTTLSETGDYYDLVLREGTFEYITASDNVSVALLIEGQGSSDMVVVLPLGFQNTTTYTFTVPDLSTDSNMTTYLVLTLKQNDTTNVNFNGEAPVDVTWFPVPGTDYVGAYIPVLDLGSTQSISNGPGEYFNAYLIGIGTETTYGSAVIPYEASEYNTESLQLSVNGSVCGSQDNVEARAMATIKEGKRKVSYELNHLRTAHAQACQMTCLLLKDCVGVNFKTESIEPEENCDILMPGSSNTIKAGAWTSYTFIR